MRGLVTGDDWLRWPAPEGTQGWQSGFITFVQCIRESPHGSLAQVGQRDRLSNAQRESKSDQG